MFKPNLASEPEGSISFPKWASAKLDGIRVVTKFGDALTRSLKPVPNGHIRDLLSPYQNLDGEVIVGNPTASDCYRQTNSAVMSFDGSPEITYYVFDDLSRPDLTFEERYTILRARELPSYIQILPQAAVQAQDAMATMYGTLLDLGYEGLILRNPSATYKYGRSTAKSQDMLKCKPFADSEAVVLSVYEAMENQNEAFKNELGQTERTTHAENLVGKSMLGGFIAKDIKSGVEFNCAPGKMDHEERTTLWGVPLAGRILKYRFMPYGQKDKPRFPRFIGWRDKLDMGG